MSQFARPTSTPTASASSMVFSKGKHLIVRQGAVLPDRCIKCNGHADAKPLKKTFYWHEPAWYALIFLGVIIYAIVAICIRKQIKLMLPLCSHHRQLRLIHTAVGLGSVIGGLVMLIGGAAMESGAVALFGVGVFLFGLIYAVITSQAIAPRYIDNNVAKFTGAGQEYLASLPVWQGHEPG